MGRGLALGGWSQAVAETANWPAARAGRAIAIDRRRSMRLWLTVVIPLARNPSLLRPARGHDSRDLSSRDFRRRSWHLARGRAGCQASQGLFPPPLWMRASHVLVHGQRQDITPRCARQRPRVLFLGHAHARERFRARCGDPFAIAPPWRRISRVRAANARHLNRGRVSVRIRVDHGLNLSATVVRVDQDGSIEPRGVSAPGGLTH